MTDRQKPKCDDGYSCGRGCISKADDCLATLEGPALALATNLVNIIQNSGKAQTKMSPDEVDALADKDNLAFLSKATPAEIIDRAFSRAKTELGDDYVDDPAVIESVWSKLDVKTKGKLRRKGKVAKDDHWNPDDSSGNGIANDVRGKYMLELYIKQNGRDAYTGLPIDLLGSDLEHIVPYSVGGKKSERPENMVLLSRSVNRNRANTELPVWLDRVASDPEATKAKLSKPPKIDKNALEEVLATTDKDSWTDDDVEKFGSKFYYISKAVGLKNTYTYQMASGRSASSRPPASWGKPIAKRMAEALRNKDVAKAAEITKVNDRLLKAESDAKSGRIKKADLVDLVANSMLEL